MKIFSNSSDSVCIIIPHLNEKQIILDCLDSIRKKTEFLNHFIVVVDNGSRDGSVSAIRNKFPEVKLICNKTNLGFPKAINQAVRAYPAKYYFLLNNDTIIIQPYWLKTLVKIMEENEDLGILGTKQISPVEVGNFLKQIEKLAVSEKLNFQNFVFYGQVLIRSKVFLSAGLLDEDFSPAYIEDHDHCFRALKKGWKLAIIPSIRIVHLGMVTGSKLKLYKSYLLIRNSILFMLYNFNLRKCIMKISGMYYRILKTIVPGRELPPGLKVTPMAMWFYIKNMIPIIKKRIYRLRDPTYSKPINFR